MDNQNNSLYSFILNLKENAVDHLIDYCHIYSCCSQIGALSLLLHINENNEFSEILEQNGFCGRTLSSFFTHI